MIIDINSLPPNDQYKLLIGTIVPRPIALITTYSEVSGDNAAPFSLFNVMGEDPPVLVVSLESRKTDHSLKDTTLNIMENGQFVAHTVDENLSQAMNICAADFPPTISEAGVAGLTLVPAKVVKAKLIQEAPVAFECEKIAFIQINPHRNILLAKVLMMHVRDNIIDPTTWRVNKENYHPIGRLFGPSYTRTNDTFDMTIPKY